MFYSDSPWWSGYRMVLHGGPGNIAACRDRGWVGETLLIGDIGKTKTRTLTGYPD
jgi:hypothetical protein